MKAQNFQTMVPEREERARSPKKNYNSSGPKDAVMLSASEVCKITCAGQQTYKEHLEGQRHKKKVALAKGDQQQTLPRSKV